MALECPKCGLFNPDGSSKCDCGFKFVPGASTVSARQVPTGVRIYLGIQFVIATWLIYMAATAPPHRYSWQPSDAELRAEFAMTILWAVVALVLSLNLIARKNWARIALAIWTLPPGVFLLLSPSARDFTSAEGEPAELRLRG